MTTVKCIKSLYKSTYKSKAFIKNKFYILDSKEPDMDFVWVIDEMDHKFNFTTTKDETTYFYRFDDYFKLLTDIVN
jgi:hypothetical protein